MEKINPHFGFTVNWQKQNLKPGNVVLVKSDQMCSNILDVFSKDCFDIFVIGHTKTDDDKDEFFASDIWSGELIDKASSIELLGIRLRGHYISCRRVNLKYVYENAIDFVMDNW